MLIKYWQEGTALYAGVLVPLVQWWIIWWARWGGEMAMAKFQGLASVAPCKPAVPVGVST